MESMIAASTHSGSLRLQPNSRISGRAVRGVPRKTMPKALVKQRTASPPISTSAMMANDAPTAPAAPAPSSQPKSPR